MEWKISVEDFLADFGGLPVVFAHGDACGVVVVDGEGPHLEGDVAEFVLVAAYEVDEPVGSGVLGEVLNPVRVAEAGEVAVVLLCACELS